MRRFWLSMMLLLTIFGWSWGSAMPAEASSVQAPLIINTQSARSAEALFREAYANRYTWNEAFPGYEADVAIQQGGNSYAGKASLMADFAVAVQSIPDKDIQQVIVAQLQMSATHLQRVEFNALHQDHQFELTGFDQDGSAKIQEVGDQTDSHYRVKQQQIRQVNRVLGNFAVEVNTVEAQQTSDGYLTTHFQVIFRDAKTGEVVEQDDIQDVYSKVTGYYILAEREIRVGLENLAPIADTTIQFSNIQLKA